MGADNGRGGGGDVVWPVQEGSTAREPKGDVVGGVEWLRGVGRDRCMRVREGDVDGEGEREQWWWDHGRGWPTVKVKGGRQWCRWLHGEWRGRMSRAEEGMTVWGAVGLRVRGRRGVGERLSFWRSWVGAVEGGRR